MFFRPEEIHAASSHTPRYLLRRGLRKRDIHVRHYRRGVDLHYFFIPHANEDGLAAIETASVDADLDAGEEPAHGQRFNASLAVPPLISPYCHKIVGRYVGKWSPGLDIIRIFHEPAG